MPCCCSYCTVLVCAASTPGKLSITAPLHRLRLSYQSCEARIGNAQLVLFSTQSAFHQSLTQALESVLRQCKRILSSVSLQWQPGHFSLTTPQDSIFDVGVPCLEMHHCSCSTRNQAVEHLLLPFSSGCSYISTLPVHWMSIISVCSKCFHARLYTRSLSTVFTAVPANSECSL